MNNSGQDYQYDLASRPEAIEGLESVLLGSADGTFGSGTLNAAIQSSLQNGGQAVPVQTRAYLQSGLVGVGEIEVTIDGSLTADGTTGAWEFTANVSGVSESFDFNPKPWGERALAAEAATRVGAGMEAVGAATPYEVIYLGSFEIRAAGAVPANLLPPPPPRRGRSVP